MEAASRQIGKIEASWSSRRLPDAAGKGPMVHLQIRVLTEAGEEVADMAGFYTSRAEYLTDHQAMMRRIADGPL